MIKILALSKGPLRIGYLFAWRQKQKQFPKFGILRINLDNGRWYPIYWNQLWCFFSKNIQKLNLMFASIMPFCQLHIFIENQNHDNYTYILVINCVLPVDTCCSDYRFFMYLCLCSQMATTQLMWKCLHCKMLSMQYHSCTDGKLDTNESLYHMQIVVVPVHSW